MRTAYRGGVESHQALAGFDLASTRPAQPPGGDSVTPAIVPTSVAAAAGSTGSKGQAPKEESE